MSVLLTDEGVVRYVMDEIRKSFPTEYRILEERGLLDKLQTAISALVYSRMTKNYAYGLCTRFIDCLNKPYDCSECIKRAVWLRIYKDVYDIIRRLLIAS
ncbi:MAG: hypothetical protein JZD41_03650 [Thermoproteus sp.]|nr:hypothetical protein [Thermoproteus sp.]